MYSSAHHGHEWLHTHAHLNLIVSGAEGYKEQTFLFLSSGQR